VAGNEERLKDGQREAWRKTQYGIGVKRAGETNGNSEAIAAAAWAGMGKAKTWRQRRREAGDGIWRQWWAAWRRRHQAEISWRASRSRGGMRMAALQRYRQQREK